MGLITPFIKTIKDWAMGGLVILKLSNNNSHVHTLKMVPFSYLLGKQMVTDAKLTAFIGKLAFSSVK